MNEQAMQMQPKSEASAIPEFKISIKDIMEHAEAASGLPGWKAHSWSLVENGSVVRGCVPDGMITRGPNKGQPRFANPIAGTQRTIVVSSRDMQRMAFKFEQNEGKCYDCRGTGKIFAGWNRESGVRKKPCQRCGASGHPLAGPSEQLFD